MNTLSAALIRNENPNIICSPGRRQTQPAEIWVEQKRLKSMGLISTTSQPDHAFKDSRLVDLLLFQYRGK